MSLLEYQEPHAKQLIKALAETNAVAIDASDTGTGKTYTAAYVCRELHVKPIVIAPKSTLLNWKRVLDLFDIEYHGIVNYESFKGGKWYVYDKNSVGTDELGNLVTCPFLERKGRGLKKERYKWVGLGNDDIFIVDEAHRCKNPATNNSKMLLSTLDIDCRKLLLSATIADKPKFFAVFAVMLGFCEDVDAYRLFMRKLEVGRGVKSVRDFLERQKNKDGTTIMLELHRMIFPEHGSRMKISELGDKFPKNQIKADTYIMDDETVVKIRQAYDSIAAVSVKAEVAEMIAEHPLARMIRARQKIEALKVKTMVELCTDEIDNGNSVAIFVNFLDTMDLLIDELRQKGEDYYVSCVIKGGQSLKERQAMIDRFQADEEHIIICQIQSGGVGISLHDIQGERPRVSIISPSWSAQDLMQTFGRIHRAGGQSVCIQKLVYCHGTVEERICKLVNMKLINYAQLNDGKKLD